MKNNKLKKRLMAHLTEMLDLSIPPSENPSLSRIDLYTKNDSRLDTKTMHFLFDNHTTKVMRFGQRACLQLLVTTMDISKWWDDLRII